MGLFDDDRLAGQLKLRMELIWRFGTAIGSANSNFGWSSLGKPARLPGLQTRSLTQHARPPLSSPTACVRVWHTQARSGNPASNLPQFFLKLFFLKELFLRAERINGRDEREFPG
jgi:hypothetical protein